MLDLCRLVLGSFWLVSELTWLGGTHARARARVCVWLCVFTSFHREGFICLETDQRCCADDVGFLCRFPSWLLWSAEPNLSASHSILSYTRSEDSHNLTSICLTFRTWGLHSSLSGVAFGTHYIVSRSAFASAIARRFAFYLGKAKVTTNFSIESKPRQSI